MQPSLVTCMAALCGWPGFLQLLSGQCSPDRQCTCAKLSLAAGVHFAKLTPTRSFAVLLSAAAVRLISLKSQIPDTVMQTVVCIHAACLISFAIMYKILPSGLNTCRDGGYFMCGSGSPHVCMIISESLSFPCKLELQRWLHATCCIEAAYGRGCHSGLMFCAASISVAICLRSIPVPQMCSESVPTRLCSQGRLLRCAVCQRAPRRLLRCLAGRGILVMDPK